jgi:hypothetical protein
MLSVLLISLFILIFDEFTYVNDVLLFLEFLSSNVYLFLGRHVTFICTIIHKHTEFMYVM